MIGPGSDKNEINETITNDDLPSTHLKIRNVEDHPSNWVNLSNPVKNNIDSRDEYLPNAVNGEEVAKKVEIFPLTSP